MLSRPKLPYGVYVSLNINQSIISCYETSRCGHIVITKQSNLSPSTPKKKNTCFFVMGNYITPTYKIQNFDNLKETSNTMALCTKAMLSKGAVKPFPLGLDELFSNQNNAKNVSWRINKRTTLMTGTGNDVTKHHMTLFGYSLGVWHFLNMSFVYSSGYV